MRQGGIMWCWHAGSGVFPGPGVAGASYSMPTALKELKAVEEEVELAQGGGKVVNMKMELMHQRPKVDYSMVTLMTILTSVLKNKRKGTCKLGFLLSVSCAV